MISQDFFNQSINRAGTNSIKWDEFSTPQGEELNPFWIADMDFACPPAVTEALIERAKHPIYGYTEQPAKAKQAMLDFMKRHHNLSLSVNDQVMLPCVITGLRIAVSVYSNVGDSVIIQPPVYNPFFDSIEEQERNVALCPLLRDENNYYQMDYEAIENACKAGAKVMLLCNPHNPVGRCFTKEELTKLYLLLKQYDVLLVSDEIHQDFVFSPHVFTPILTIATEEDAKVVALSSVSKTFNVAGLQQAVLLTRNQTIKTKIEKSLHSIGVTAGNIFAIVGTEAAYRYGDEWLEAVSIYLKKGYDILCEEIHKRLNKAIVTPLEATYLAWVDVSAYGLTTSEVIKRSIEQGVAFTAGTIYGKEEGEGFLRINFGCPHERIVDAIIRLEKAIVKK